MADTDTPLAYSMDEAPQIVAVGRTTLFNEAKAGRLKVTKIGGRTVILREDLLAWLRERRDATATTAVAS